MDNEKDDNYYLKKIIDDLKIIIKNTNKISHDDLNTDTLLSDSVLFRIIQISENCKKLSENFKMKFPNIPWRAII